PVCRLPVTDRGGADPGLEILRRCQPVRDLLVALSQQRRGDEPEAAPDCRAQPAVAVGDTEETAGVTHCQRWEAGRPGAVVKKCSFNSSGKKDPAERPSTASCSSHFAVSACSWST